MPDLMPTIGVDAPDDRRQRQLESWARDPHRRRKAIALGGVRSLLRDHPGDLCDVVTAAVEAVNEAEVTP